MQKNTVISLLLLSWLSLSTAAFSDSLNNDSSYDRSNDGYAGSSSCRTCHALEYKQWMSSDHFRSMSTISNDTEIFGHKSDAQIKTNKGLFAFSKKNSGGRTFQELIEKKEFPVNYQFGYFPLMQFLADLPDGRKQVIPLAWDTSSSKISAESMKQGISQRWFHLYTEEEITNNHPLYWKDHFQNWNSRCAHCHSTNLRKNYDASNNTFDTQWSEVNVACEACHGPAQDHVNNPYKKSGSDRLKMDKLKNENHWIFHSGAKIAMNKGYEERKSRSIEGDKQNGVCASCHSLNGVIGDLNSNENFYDKHQLRLLDQNFYHYDGQIKEEVFVYGSFLQSKMHQKGVVCSDCHNPHSGKLKKEGNEVCSSCHNRKFYDNEEHHQHLPSSEGAQCINCHMPAKNFMKIDPRRDHSFKIPRPDHSIQFNTPNACQTCHLEKGNRWALDAIKKWKKHLLDDDFTGAFFEASERGRGYKLVMIIDDGSQPSIVRASALQLLIPTDYAEKSKIAIKYIDAPSALIRRAAIQLLEPYIAQEYHLLVKKLKDPIKSVRLEAARVIIPISNQLMKVTEYKVDIENALIEYQKTQNINADMPNAQLNLAELHLAQGNIEDAEKAYLLAKEQAPNYPPVYINLAELYKRLGREEKSIQLLETLIDKNPSYAPAYYSLGLLQYKANHLAIAEESLFSAYDYDPNVIRHIIAYVLILEKNNKKKEAKEILLNVYGKHKEVLELKALFEKYKIQ